MNQNLKDYNMSFKLCDRLKACRSIALQSQALFLHYLITNQYPEIRIYLFLITYENNIPWMIFDNHLDHSSISILKVFE